jgi:acetoin utilization protein AcuC
LDERGGPDAEGSAVNVPLPPGTADDAWLDAFRTVIPPVVRRFGPDVLVTQLGCDTHVSDPLAHLRLTTRAYREAAAELHGLAHEAAGGRWVATGGGGYQWARVVPRAWTTYFAEMAGAEIPDHLPEGWIERTEFLLRAEVPVTMSEPPEPPGRGDAEVPAIARAALERFLETAPEEA